MRFLSSRHGNGVRGHGAGALKCEPAEQQQTCWTPFLGMGLGLVIEGNGCCRAETLVVPGEATGQQRRMLPWSQSLGPELGPRQAERVLRKWQVGLRHCIPPHRSIKASFILSRTSRTPEVCRRAHVMGASLGGECKSELVRRHTELQFCFICRRSRLRPWALGTVQQL